MTPERFHEIEAVVSAVLELPPAQRAAALAELCGNDDVLFRQASLLVDAEPAEDFLEEASAPGFALESAVMSGQVVGAWRLEKMLGRGGMGSVFLGSRADGLFGRKVAVKLLDVVTPGAGFEERFRRESEILGRLDHPGIARLLDAGTSDEGVPYFVMELVDGLPCTEWARAGNAARAEVVTLFLRICDAVQYAHGSLVVHRDLKPANVLVDAAGHPHLVDFGIARMLDGAQGEQTRTGFRAFSLNYASPEQILGKPATTSDDVYALGVILYELITGQPAYRLSAKELPEILRFAEAPEFPSPRTAAGIDEDLDAVILKAMAPDRGLRYESPAALAADLRLYRAGFPVQAGRPRVWQSVRKFIRRRWAAVAVTAAILLAVSAGATTTYLQWRRAERRFDDARSLARYVLFDLYDSLSALPGTLGPRSRLAQKTQEYLDRLAADGERGRDLAPDLAESYERLGDLQGLPYRGNLGDSTGAAASYRKAVVLLESAGAGHADQPLLTGKLVRTLVREGKILLRQRQTYPARLSLERAVRMAEGLKDTGLLAEALMALGEARFLEAESHRSIAEFEQVLATYRKALAVQEQGKQSGEDDVRAASIFRIGYTQQRLGELGAGQHYFHEALGSYLAGEDIGRKLLGNHANEPGGQRQLADGLNSIAWARWLCCQDLTGALRDSEQARTVMHRLAEADPQNRELRRDTGEVELYAGRIYSAAGQKAQARPHYLKALAVFDEMGTTDPTSGENLDRLREVKAWLEAAHSP